MISEILGEWGKRATAACVDQEENVIYKQYEENDVHVVDLSEEAMADFRAVGQTVVREQERGDEVLAAVAEVEAALKG